MIYCVEDDEGIRELVVYTLQNSGLPARGFADGDALSSALREGKPDLILLDIMLPGEDGVSILRALRRRPDTEKLPVILLTAKGSEYDKVIGLDSGADDYIAKPFGMMELLARVRAVLRRIQPEGEAVADALRAGPVSVDPRAHETFVNGQKVRLTLKEYELLCLLMRSRGAVLTRDVLLETIWGYCTESETRTVDVHIRTLRQKLGDAGEMIETVRGVGYRLRGEA
ncbi:response regulator transcription factor [Butyricicoccus faecihominis]|uniref:winged helix-turn-helix domain-containing protein n=1 Tax=Agathobaculum sp. NTUH-O15-33 TaxID=3079302 RepID=UPI00247B14D6|nr:MULTISPECIES: response regulator transcription factor [Butyricicoccaceae]MCQ5131041.1 response regulator transcription factor [Butyricicoccus faecihominis]WNX85099.1 response regulator transcription factor [Agathobaculum sp. NTUH-O15-33]